MLEQPEGIVRPLLGKLGANMQVVLSDCQAAVARFPRVQGGQQYFSPRLTQIFTAAQKQARRCRTSTSRPSISYWQLPKRRTVRGERFFASTASSATDLLKVIEQTRGGARITDQNAEANYQALSKICSRFNRPGAPGKT